MSNTAACRMCIVRTPVTNGETEAVGHGRDTACPQALCSTPALSLTPRSQVSKGSLPTHARPTPNPMRVPFNRTVPARNSRACLQSQREGAGRHPLHSGRRRRSELFTQKGNVPGPPRPRVREAARGVGTGRGFEASSSKDWHGSRRHVRTGIPVSKCS